MLPVYVINLDRRADRWEAMSAQLDRLGMDAMRIPAIDRETLAGDPALLKLGAGHVACARSHYKAMQALVASGAPAALILEDDVEIGEAVPSLIGTVDWWPGEHGLVKLGSTNRADMRIWLGRPVGATPDGRELRPLALSHLGAYGYLIDYDAALDVLDIAPATPMPIDHLLFDLGNSFLVPDLRPLQMLPGAIRHLPRELFGSETGESRVNGQRLWKHNRRARLSRKTRWIWEVVQGKAKRVNVGYRSVQDSNLDAI